jgi:methyl-accepting chemotaxis protein
MRTLSAAITSLSIGAKIAIVMALTLLPIGHLTLLFVQQIRKDIAFSSLEVTGARVLTDVWSALAVSVDQASPADRLAEAAARVARQQAAADALKAGESLSTFGRALAEGRDRSAVWEAGQRAIQKIADGSNLTLDPDVDSFYAMDVVAVRLPELVIARAALEAAMKPATIMPATTLSARERYALAEASARYTIALAAVQSSLESSAAGNQDGSVAASLAAPRAAFTAAASQVARHAAQLREAIMSERPPALARAEVDAASAAFGAVADALWHGTQKQLVRLIENRIEGYEVRARRDLALAALAALLTLGVALLFVRSIRRPLADLVMTLRRHEAQEYGQPVPHTRLSNEIGEIARAIDQARIEAGRGALTVSAMNQSPTMLMITDPGETITFVSASLLRMLKTLEPVFREASPDFSVDRMVGKHVDFYRANRHLKRELILDDGAVRKVRYRVGSEVLAVDMSYIQDAAGDVIGHTLIWRNITNELREADVAAVVDAARRGDFSARLAVAEQQGFVRDVSMGLNEISAVVEQAAEEFAQVMQAVANADLTCSVKGDYHGIFGLLKNAINATIDRLSATVKTIQATSSEVGLAAREINMGADDLSKRTEEQASSLEETAATTEQLAASVKGTAQASRQAAAIADEAMKAAQNGGAIAGQAVDAMARIEEASQRISDIIRIIDDIAFQTNLLALNAAVEAARAGDAGKGFAVVASEVRTLAQRSSDAAKDISALIASSNTEVGAGVKLVRQAGEALEQILGASQKVAATIAEISATSGEQASGIDEISQAVAHLDEMTQQNAALSEQSAASAGSLSGKIAELNDLVAAFRTSHGSSATVSVPKPTTEPARLRQLAAAAFAKAPAQPEAQAPRAPFKKAANSHGGGAGWEEF